MKHFHWTILAASLFLTKIQAQTFEKVKAKIYVLNSCSKQAHISIEFQNIYPEFNEIKDSLIVKWKKDNKIVQVGSARGFLATEFGNYSCEILLNKKSIMSNNLELKNFEFSTLFGDRFVGPSFFQQSICFKEFFKKDTYLDKNNYYFGAPSVEYNINKISDDKVTASFNWLIGDEIIPEQSIKNIQGNRLKIRLNLNEGLCNFFSKENEVFNNELVFKPSKSIYEYCQGDTAKIPGIFYPVFGKPEKYSWFKDDKLFFEIISDNINPHKPDLITTQSGKYVLRKSTTNKFDNSIPVFDENSCIYRTDTIVIKFRNEVQFKNSNYISNSYPEYQKLDKILCNSPAVELITDSLTQNFEWFKDEILLPKNEYILIKTENKNTDLNKSKKIFFNQIKLNEPGRYFAKIHINKSCIAITDTLTYNGETKFDLELPNLCDGFTFPLIKMDWETKYQSDYIISWKLDNQTIKYEELKSKTSGTFQAIAQNKNNNCVIESKPLKFEFKKVNLALNYPENLDLCPEINANLFLKDTNLNYKIFDWVKNGNFLNVRNRILTVNQPGIYSLIFKDSICNNYTSSNTIKINEIRAPTAMLSGSNSIDYGQSTQLKIDLTSSPPWEVKLNIGEAFSIAKSPYMHIVQPLSDITYRIESVKNICGLGTSAGEAIIKILILADEQTPQSESDLKVYPIPVSDIFEVEISKATCEKVKVILLDLSGKIIEYGEYKMSNGHTNLLFSSKLYPSGQYILKAIINDQIYVKKIVKN